MTPEQLLAAHGDRLREAGDAVFAGRRAFLRERFEGYVADTYRVRDAAYVCWPALTDGRFEAYDECCEAERTAVEPLEDVGFELVGVGLSSVVLSPPGNDSDLVVKLGRCGMGGGFGDGRRANLVEARLSAAAEPNAPIVPSRYCSPRGSVAVYPDVSDGLGTTDLGSAVDAGHPDEAATGAQDAGDDDGGPAAIRAWLADHAPWVDRTEALAPENLCRWRGRVRTLDYSFPGDVDGPLGLPAHVDGSAVVERVDERRRAGEKPDLADGGGLLDPEPE